MADGHVTFIIFPSFSFSFSFTLGEHASTGRFLYNKTTTNDDQDTMTATTKQWRLQFLSLSPSLPLKTKHILSSFSLSFFLFHFASLATAAATSGGRFDGGGSNSNSKAGIKSQPATPKGCAYQRLGGNTTAPCSTCLSLRSPSPRRLRGRHFLVRCATIPFVPHVALSLPLFRFLFRPLSHSLCRRDETDREPSLVAHTHATPEKKAPSRGATHSRGPRRGYRGGRPRAKGDTRDTESRANETPCITRSSRLTQPPSRYPAIRGRARFPRATTDWAPRRNARGYLCPPARQPPPCTSPHARYAARLCCTVRVNCNQDWF